MAGVIMGLELGGVGRIQDTGSVVYTVAANERAVIHVATDAGLRNSEIDTSGANFVRPVGFDHFAALATRQVVTSSIVSAADLLSGGEL